MKASEQRTPLPCRGPRTEDEDHVAQAPLKAGCAGFGGAGEAVEASSLSVVLEAGAPCPEETPQAWAAGSSGRPGALGTPGSGRGLRRGFPGTMCSVSAALSPRQDDRVAGPSPAARQPCTRPAHVWPPSDGPPSRRGTVSSSPLGKVKPASPVWGVEGVCFTIGVT